MKYNNENCDFHVIVMQWLDDDLCCNASMIMLLAEINEGKHGVIFERRNTHFEHEMIFRINFSSICQNLKDRLKKSFALDRVMLFYCFAIWRKQRYEPSKILNKNSKIKNSILIITFHFATCRFSVSYH